MVAEEERQNIRLSDEVFTLLPSDVEQANQLVNEILEQALSAMQEPPQAKLKNRPDWQEKIERSRQQIAKGELVSHEEVSDWISRQQR